MRDLTFAREAFRLPGSMLDRDLKATDESRNG